MGIAGGVLVGGNRSGVGSGGVTSSFRLALFIYQSKDVSSVAGKGEELSKVRRDPR